MSVIIYIMRHGIAEENAASGDDADRRLTPEGRRKVVEVARGLKTLDVKPNAILSSPLPRALETATLAGSVLDADLDVETLLTLGPGYDALATLNSLPSGLRESIMLVGHQPHLGELASCLLTGSQSLVPLPFKKGAVAAIQVAALPPRSAGVLQWFLSPRQLRGLA
jgi:phosphohistidine phosphatase